MRISDGSSDVCSSDLFIWALPQVARDGFVAFDEQGGDGEDDVQAFDAVDFLLAIGREAVVATEFSTQIVSSPSGHEQRDRKSVVSGKSVAVRVDFGGRRIIKKTRKNKYNIYDT